MSRDEIHELDELLSEIARGAYNPPPPTPREAIWAGIETARAARLNGAASSRPSGTEFAAAEPGEERAPRRGIAPRGIPWWGVGIAATIVLGIGLGRIAFVSGPQGETTTAPAVVHLGEEPIVVEPGTPTEGAVEVTGENVATDPPLDPGPTQPPTRLAELPAEAAPARRGPQTEARPFRFAALEHLVRTELFLTGFLVDARTGQLDADLEGGARELLAETRLLLDSPAAEEPRLGDLLLDLELVLAQIARFPENPTLAEFELIDQALVENDVVTRLRLAVPSGPLLAMS